MNVRETDDFISDIERQFEWYALNANWEIAERYLDAVEATAKLLKKHGHRDLPRRLLDS
jgi:plasmid stabilization system protein ParE